MTDLFEAAGERRRAALAPLADRLRPRTLDEFAGQDHILAPGKLLRRAIEADRLTSLIFYGPPGTGKTTLARIIARSTAAHFTALNAVLAGVKDIRLAIEAATQRLNLHQQRTILFVDEVHRFNKTQQDALLPHVENGRITFIGATTENPYFEVIKALVSRSRIFELHALTNPDLEQVLRHALTDTARGYGRQPITLDDEAEQHLVSTANGDARTLLNALELAVETTPPDAEGHLHITLAIAEDSIQQRAVRYDKNGDLHYDVTSAFIKSLRGSDPDAALYWLARMVYAGEDPRFILRRMVIFAAEDIGLADPRAMQVAAACAQGFEYVGLPEGRYLLAECCLYLATAPKSNSTKAFFKALDHIANESTGEVPNPMKDGSRDYHALGHGKGYMSPHHYPDHHVAQQYLPDTALGVRFYEPGTLGYEREVAERLARWRAAEPAASD